MKSLLICSKLRDLTSHSKWVSDNSVYLCLVDNHASREIQEYLGEDLRIQPISRKDLFKDKQEEFKKKYIEFIAQLNIENHSLLWWAMTFTNKNPLATQLCRNVAYSLAISSYLANNPYSLILIIDEDYVDLADQLTAWSGTQGINARNVMSRQQFFRRFLKRYTPAGVVRASIRTLFLLIQLRRYRIRADNGKDNVVIASLSHPRSFHGDQGYHDAYFGPLGSQGVIQGFNVILFMILVEQPFQQVRDLKKLKDTLPIVPVESCLTLRSFVSCIARSLVFGLAPLTIRGSLKIDGIDLSILMKSTLEISRRSGDLFLNLRLYYSSKWLSENMGVSRFFYPFENRSWEKMILMGLADGMGAINVSGYQHSALTQSHTNFMLAPKEAEITPLPNRILTTGQVITNWLESCGNYPVGIFRTACALRQDPIQNVGGKERSERKFTRILVALASGWHEYSQTFAFLRCSLADSNEFEIRIRPHPEFPMSDDLCCGFPYSKSIGVLADDLQWADVVLYASSTVGLQAISWGIPVVHLNLGGFLNTDPLSGWSDFRWGADNPDHLISIINDIRNLSEEEYHLRKQKALEYAADYLKPATDDSISIFWEQ